MTARCANDTPLTTLLAYWLAELNASEESAVEDHLFACAHCHVRLAQVADLGKDIRNSMRTGQLNAVLTPDFVANLRASGLRVREYRLPAGGSVNCTIAPEDDLVVSYLSAPLAGVSRLDLVSHDGPSGMSLRVEDVAFVPGTDEIAVATDTAYLRKLPRSTQRIELIAVDGQEQRLIGRYTFNHSPHDSSPGGAPSR